jgi:branched-chain amino acid aminotransferase
MAINNYLYQLQMVDNVLIEINSFDNRVDDSTKTVYEIFRIISGIPLFIEDHFGRLIQSLEIIRCNYKVDIEDIKYKINQLCQANSVFFGNMELKVNCFDNQSPALQIGFIPHVYPTPSQYLQGVELVSLQVERENPQAKVKDTSARMKANALLAQTGVYEVLLVNHLGFITEGSRSNIFIIKGGKVYSAPDDLILSGITRKHVIELLKRINIELIKEPFLFEHLSSAEAVFLCGTSPGVIAVSTIDQINFDVKHPIIQQIIAEFNHEVSAYLKNYK